MREIDAFWQGAVRALITANPSSAKPGQPVSVILSVLGPQGPITDPATLSQMAVRVSRRVIRCPPKDLPRSPKDGSCVAEARRLEAPPV